jgi:transposase InsO family protein
LHIMTGHTSMPKLQRAIQNGRYQGVTVDMKSPIHQCNTCHLMKMTRQTTPKTVSIRNTSPFQVIRLDLVGPLPRSRKGEYYLLTVLEDHYKIRYTIPLIRKSDTFKEIQALVKHIYMQYDLRVKILRTDNGGEFIGKNWDQWTKSTGIAQEHNNPRTESQAGMVERANRTIVEMGRCMLKDSGLPTKYFLDAIQHAGWLLNRTPDRSLGHRSPYEALYGYAPMINNLIPFGAKIYRWIPKDQRTKASGTSDIGRYLGSGPYQNRGCYVLKSNGQVVLTKDVKLVTNTLETVLPSAICTERSFRPAKAMDAIRGGTVGRGLRTNIKHAYATGGTRDALTKHKRHTVMVNGMPYDGLAFGR